MPAPELPPPQPRLPEAASRFGAHVLAEAASRARDIGAAAGGLPRPPALSLTAAPAPAEPAAPT
ncbi:2-methylisoborneol synthase, partial [Streptomyces sp. AC154]